MSNTPEQNPTPSEPGAFRVFLSAAGWIAMMFVFVFIMIVVHFPNRSEPVDSQRVEMRKERLAELRAEQHGIARGYQVVDREEGIVRIPIERARDLMAERLDRADMEEVPREPEDNDS